VVISPVLRLAVGDRVQHPLGKRGGPEGTVVRILRTEGDPQIVEVAIGDRVPPLLIVLPASKLVKLQAA
jgi:hypothetical protein